MNLSGKYNLVLIGGCQNLLECMKNWCFSLWIWNEALNVLNVLFIYVSEFWFWKLFCKGIIL